MCQTLCAQCEINGNTSALKGLMKDRDDFDSNLLHDVKLKTPHIVVQYILKHYKPEKLLHTSYLVPCKLLKEMVL